MNENVVTAKGKYSKFGFVYGITFIAYCALVLVAYAIIKAIGHGEINGTAAVVTDQAIRFLIMYPAIYLLIRSIPKVDMPKKDLSVGRILISICIAYTIMYISNLVGIGLNAALGKLTGVGGITPLADMLAYIPLPLQFLFVVILAPICEELLFRKFLLDRVTNYSEFGAMLMSGLMFGLYHANLPQFVYAFSLGCFFAYIYIRTGKIIYTIILHMFINGFSQFMTNVVFGDLDMTELVQALNNGDAEGMNRFMQENAAAMAGSTIYSLLIYVLVILGIVFMIVHRKKVHFDSHAEEVMKGQRFKTFVLNAGMILYIVVFVAMIISTQLGCDLVALVAMKLGLV